MISRRTFLVGAGQLVTAATLQRYIAAIGSGSGPVIDAPIRTDYELVVITGEWSHMIGLWRDGLPVWGDSGSPYAEAYKLLHDLNIGEKLRGRNGEVGGLDFVQKVYDKGLQISARCAGRGAGQKDLSISLLQAHLREMGEPARVVASSQPWDRYYCIWGSGRVEDWYKRNFPVKDDGGKYEPG